MCEYCKKIVNNKKIKDIDNDKEDFLEILYQDMLGNMIHVELDGKDEDGYKTSDFFQINYCPMCGRKFENAKEVF